MECALSAQPKERWHLDRNAPEGPDAVFAHVPAEEFACGGRPRCAVCSAYLRLPLEKVYAFEPTPVELSEDEARHVLGTQANLWTERMHTTRHVEYQAIPRMCALAEVAWTPAAEREWEGFCTRIEGHLHHLGELGYHYRHLDSAERRIPL